MKRGYLYAHEWSEREQCGELERLFALIRDHITEWQGTATANDLAALAVVERTLRQDGDAS